MNWYKVIKFSNKMIPISDMANHAFQAIQLLNTGNWAIEHTTKSIPSYEMQTHLVCSLRGTDVIYQADWFSVQVHIFIKKAPHVVHPSEGTYGIAGDWREPNMIPTVLEETIETRWENLNAMKPMEVNEYNSEEGHELIKFLVTIHGDLNKQKGDLNVRRIGIKENLKTPYEIANYVKTTINNFYFGGDANDEPEDNPVPPTPGVEVEDREYSYV